MAEEVKGLAQPPDGLSKRQRLVTLADGSTVVIYKWSNQKHPELLPMVGLLPHVATIAEQSVAEADRERVRAMEFDDQLTISTAATELCVTPSVLKNLEALLNQRQGLEDALKKRQGPSNPS